MLKNINICWFLFQNSLEFNSESKPKLILALGLGLSVTQNPDPIYAF